MSAHESILVVDDDNVVRLLLRNELQKAGFRVVLAKDAQEALPSLKNETFIVALVEKQLPDMDGIDLMREIRSIDPKVELVLITGYASFEAAIEAINIGIFDYITKPFDYMPGVVQRIQRAVEKRRKNDMVDQLIASLRDSNRQLVASMELLHDSFREMAKIISRIIGMQSPEWRNEENEHVRTLAVDIGVAMGLDAEHMGWLSLAAMLRDVGQSDDIEKIIQSADKLQASEYDKVKQLPKVSSTLLEPIPGFGELVKIVRHQREWYDGSGYPSGLSGEQLPIESRIIAVAESYLAMISQRPHRAPMSSQQALQELKRCAGSQFDPAVVEVFERIVHEKTMSVQKLNSEEAPQ